MGLRVPEAFALRRLCVPLRGCVVLPAAVFTVTVLLLYHHCTAAVLQAIEAASSDLQDAYSAQASCLAEARPGG